MTLGEAASVSFPWPPAHLFTENIASRSLGQHDGHANHGTGIIEACREEFRGAQEEPRRPRNYEGSPGPRELLEYTFVQAQAVLVQSQLYCWLRSSDRRQVADGGAGIESRPSAAGSGASRFEWDEERCRCIDRVYE